MKRLLEWGLSVRNGGMLKNVSLGSRGIHRVTMREKFSKKIARSVAIESIVLVYVTVAIVISYFAG